MDVLAQIDGLETEGHSGLLGQLEAVAQVGIIGRHAEQARHDSPVSAVSLAGVSKGAVQFDQNLGRLAAEDGARHLPQSHRAGGVRTGRADHDRADDVEGGNVAGHLLMLPLSYGVRRPRFYINYGPHAIPADTLALAMFLLR